MFTLREFTEAQLAAAIRSLKEGRCLDMTDEDLQAVIASAVALLHRQMFLAGDPAYREAAAEQGELTKMIDSCGAAPATVDRLTALALKHRDSLEKALA